MAFGDLMGGRPSPSETQKIGREMMIEKAAGIMLHHQTDRAIRSYLFNNGFLEHGAQPTEIDHAIGELDEETKNQIVNKTKEDYGQIFEQIAECDYDLKSGKDTNRLTGIAGKEMTGRVFDILKQHPDFKNGSIGAAMVRLDLDGFKAINDQLGHDQGDDALRAVAQKIMYVLKQTRPADLAAHYSGDEFALILTDIRPKKGQTVEEAVENIIERVISEIESIEIPGGKKLSASAGYQIVRPGVSDNFPSADHNADLASGISKHFKFVKGLESGSTRIVNCEKSEEDVIAEKNITKEQLVESKIRAAIQRPMNDAFPKGIPAEVQSALDHTIALAMEAKRSAGEF